MTKNFIITSHTEGKYPFEQRFLLTNLVQSLKKYFPDCFIIIASASEVDWESQLLADFVLVDKVTENIPHGIGELKLIQQSLEVLEKFNKTESYKLTYDFIIDDSNYQVFDKWKAHGADFVSCLWKQLSVGIGSWCWYGKLDILKQIFNFKDLIKFMEWTIMTSIHEQNLYYRCFFYETAEEMLDNTWLEKGNLVTYEGTILKHRYGNLVVIIDLNDESELGISNTLQTLCYQSKLPNHIVIVDNRKDKKDLRNNQIFQEMFMMMSDNGITWNVIFCEQFDYLNKFLFELGYNWNYLLNKISFKDRHLIREFFETIIRDRSIGVLRDRYNNVVYRNRAVDPSLFYENADSIVDKMLEHNYNIHIMK